jgi:cytochrome c biogenesis protein CcmG/thiol:disulfide interchange protein DsbE
MKRLLSPVPLAVLLVSAALLALLAYGVSSKEQDRTVEAAIAKGERPAAPRDRLPGLDGSGSTSLADLKGKVVVLNYWASWCKPCRAEAPVLERWHRDISKRGGTVLGVDVLDVSDDARAFVRKYGISYPVLRDGDGSTQKSLGVLAYPETFVIDRGGRIAAVRRGTVDDRFLRDSVEPLL